MEAELRMKMQYDSPSVNLAEKPYINVLPNYPYEAYRPFDMQTLTQIRKTERVPLPQIRQLILMYILPETPMQPLPPPELLIQKISGSNLAQPHYLLNSLSQKWLQQQQRICRLQQVFEEYQNRRQQLVSRTVMKSKHSVQDDAQKFKTSVKQIEKQKNMRVSSFMNKSSMNRQNQFKMVQSMNMQPNGELMPEEQQQLKNIERQANLKTVAHIRSQNQQNTRYESQQQQRLYGYRYMGIYLNQLQKALVFIVGARHVQNMSQVSMVANDTYYKTFNDKLVMFLAKINQFNTTLMNHIFDWQMDIKHNRPHQAKEHVYLEKGQRLSQELQSQFYYYLPQILVNLENDREQLRSLNQYFTNNFENYLDTYYSIKEVQVYHSRQNHIEQIIQNQRQAVNIHLKKNFGMMVPYTKSHEYQQLATLAISRQKPYLKTLMEQKISHLEQAIAYINYQHSNLYKQVCDGVPGVANKIHKKLEDFSVLGSKYPQLRAHLEQSCQRLMMILNH